VLKRLTATAECCIVYSGTSIYRSHNDRFPACTVRHFLVPNEVPYKQRYLFPHPSFPELSFYCTDRSYITVPTQHFLHGSFEKKNLSKVFIICVTFSLDYKSGNTVTQSRFARGPQLRVHVISKLYFVASGSVLSGVISSIWFICFH